MIQLQKFLAGAMILVTALFTATPLQCQDRSQWFEFYLPWDDSTKTLTDMSGFLDAPAGKYGYLQVTPEGHFSFEHSGERFRQVGVVNVASSNYPLKEQSRIIAARMAKFGINLVRIHLIDVDWQHGIFENSQDNTLVLNASRLDKMDYFTKCLRDKGIYYNFCIHSGRIYKMGDGIEAPIENNQSKYLTLFNEKLIELQKDYAEKTLAHVNPYTGLAYADDPAMATLELTNENSLFNGWYGWNRDYLFEGTPGGIGTFYSRELDTLFNQWLQNKYPSDSALQNAWTGVTGTGAELIRNPSFENDLVLWHDYVNTGSGARATFELDPDTVLHGNKAIKIHVTQAGSQGWHVNLKPADFRAEKGESYRISFYAKADLEKNLNFEIMENRTWYWYGAPSYTPGPEWQKFEFYFTCTKTTDAQIIQFNYGTETGTFWLDSVSVTRFDGDGLEANESLALENVKRTPYNDMGKYSSRRIGDNAEFYFDLEKNYIDTLSLFLKNELGIKCPVTFTNNYYGLASIYAQSKADYMDTHYYWDHPNYPNGWSDTDFTLHNRAMVKDPEGSTVNRMSLSKVEGLPLVMSEYNHPYPHIYQAEAPSFLFAYGSFMDLDGIMWHAYYDYHQRFAQREQDMFFDIAMNPVVMTQMMLAMPYRKGIIQPATDPVRAHYNRQEIFDRTKHHKATETLNMPDGDFGSSFLEQGFSHGSFDSDSTYLESVLSRPGAIVNSSTGALSWNREQGVFTVNNPFWQGATGFLKGQTIELNDLSLSDVSTTEGVDFASVHILSMDSLPIRESQRLLLLTSARLENEGFLWNSTSTSPVSIGGTRALCEPVSGTLSLKYPLMDSSYLFRLNELGARSDSVQITSDDQGASIRFSHKTLWYEIKNDSATYVEPDHTGITHKETPVLINFPNPCDSFTMIRYQSKESGSARLDIINPLGRVVGSESLQLTGNQPLLTRINMEGNPEGIYLFRLRLEDGTSRQRPVLISR